jgi:hypothetical protein
MPKTKAPEVEILKNIREKLHKKFPLLLQRAMDEFMQMYKEDILKSKHSGQFFNGFLFATYTLQDGKSIIRLCNETLDLNEKEKRLLDNINQAIFGYFRVLKIEDKIILVEDMLTQKNYSIKTIDLENMQEGKIYEAKLVRNLEGDYFFFGGLEESDEARLIELNLLDYSRDLTLDELVEREIIILERMFRLSDEDSILDYLTEVIGLDFKEAEKFISEKDKKIREKLIRERIIQYWWEEPEN